LDLKKYTEAAIKTESVIDAIDTNKDRLLSILEILISAGNMLDDLKKNIFYGREIDNDKFFKQSRNVLDSVHSLEVYQKGNTDLLNQNNLKSNFLDIDTRVFHGVIGIATESTEMLEALYKTLQTGKLDKVNLEEESGDSMWYTAILLDALGINWDNSMNKNIKKLKARYKEKEFKETNANNRDLESEREILEND
jgi:NTP pyrophosphatase (non-canonical NTP hydrolase)